MQLVRFISVGAANTVVALLVIYAAKWLAGMGDVSANALGYGVGLLGSFALNSRWTFAHQGPQWPAFLKFIAVSAVAYGMNLATVLVLIHHFEINDYLAQALGIPPYTLTSFVASKFLVFRPQKPSAAA